MDVAGALMKSTGYQKIKYFRMKKLHYITCFLSILTALSLGSCKKYGFDIADGYGTDTLQQNITVDTTDSRPDYSMLAKARIFPGLVDASEPRLDNYEVTLNLNYHNEAYNRLRISVIPEPVFNTGMYAGPGEPVTIVVPEGVKGLICQIGMWTDNLTSKTPRRREPIIYDRKMLFPGVNHVRNLFGGNIYIVTSFPIEQPVKLSFTGACKSPDFELGKTDPATWKAEIAASKVPWFEFYSGHIDFTLPTSKMVDWLQKHPDVDPVTQLQAWDQIIEKDYNEWEGLSDTASDDIDKPINLAWRVVLDIDPSVGYGHNGFPVVAQDDNEWFSASMIATDTVSIWGTLHEIGHNNQQGSYWSWSTLGETTNNLFSIKRAHRIGIKNVAALHPALPGAAEDGLKYTSQDDAGKDFDKDALVNSPFTRMIPFMQLFDRIERWDGKADGYGLMSYLYWRARHAQRYSLNDLAMHDFFYEAVCEYTHLDFFKFFQAWGIQVSSQARNEMSNQYVNKLQTDIWNYNPLTRQGGNNVIDYTVKRTDWIVSSLSPSDTQNDDEETTGEGSGNGKFSELLDGNNSTYWHSRWSSAATGLPHVLLFDLSEVQTANGIYFIQRAAGSRNAKTLKIWVGNDPDDMELVTDPTFELAKNSNRQEFSFGGVKNFRYFKVEFDDGWDGSQYIAMAEIGLY